MRYLDINVQSIHRASSHRVDSGHGRRGSLSRLLGNPVNPFASQVYQETMNVRDRYWTPYKSGRRA